MLVFNYQSRLVLVLYSEYSEDFPITNSVDNSRQNEGFFLLPGIDAENV